MGDERDSIFFPSSGLTSNRLKSYSFRKIILKIVLIISCLLLLSIKVSLQFRGIKVLVYSIFIVEI